MLPKTCKWHTWTTHLPPLCCRWHIWTIYIKYFIIAPCRLIINYFVFICLLSTFTFLPSSVFYLSVLSVALPVRWKSTRIDSVANDKTNNAYWVELYQENISHFIPNFTEHTYVAFLKKKLFLSVTLFEFISMCNDIFYVLMYQYS